MPDMFNKLDPEVAELIFKLIEEQAEVIQILTKILTHGVRENPYTGVMNTEELHRELTDVETFMQLLEEVGLIDRQKIRDGVRNKRLRLSRPGILHHSTRLPPVHCQSCGTCTRILIEGPNGEVLCKDVVACVGDRGMIPDNG